MKRSAGGAIAVVFVIAITATAAGVSHRAEATPTSKLAPIQQRLLSGFLSTQLEQPDAAVAAAAAAQQSTPAAGGGADWYVPHPNGKCTERLGANVKVNQNCLNVSDPDLLGRGQAQNETAIAQDPSNPNVLVASANDYRRGDGNCYTYFSRNGGRSWGDSTPPMSFVRGDAFGGLRQYFQAGGDTSVAFDTRGNAYLSCQMFNRGTSATTNPDTSSAFYVFRSTANGGASWNFPARPVTEFADLTGETGVLEDKQLLAVDAHVSSPYRDRLYVTWTEFAEDGSAYIWEAYSSDYGESFSHRVLVSHDSPLCENNFGLGHPHGNCNENQFSYPFVGQDGTLYVAWSNFNNAAGHPIGDDEGGDGGVGGDAVNAKRADNRNQILLARSTDGGQSFSAPVLVGSYYDLPDCVTYTGQDPFRSCVPVTGPQQTSYFRAINYPQVAVDPANASHVVVTYGSYINRYSNDSNGCTPQGLSSDTGLNLFTGVGRPGGCNNKILLSESTDGARSFTGTHTGPRSLPVVNQDPGQATASQWFQGTAWSDNGKLAVSYYDRQYGNDERTGEMDVSLSGSSDLAHFGTRRVTSSSMPPETQFEGLFFGDYITLTASGNTAYPIWSDTRNDAFLACRGAGGAVTTPPSLCRVAAANASVANDQDAFTASLPIPTP